MILDLTPETDHHLQELAASTARPAEDLAREAVERFVAHRRDLSEAVKRGDADIAAGRLLSPDEVLARIQRKFATQ